MAKGTDNKNKTTPAKSKPAKTDPKKNTDKPAKEHPRIHTIDELRGFAVFCMIFFHAFFTIGYVFGLKWGVTLVDFFYPAEPYFAGLFILISGLACNLSHSNLERGVKLALISLAVTLVTYLVLGSKNMIQFGILHFLAAAMIFYGLANKYLKLIPAVAGIILNVLLFVFTFNIVENHTVGLPFIFSINVPDSWYSTKYLFMFGLPDKSFTSSDYFPIIPWLFLFIAGAFLGMIAVRKKFPKFMFKKRIPPLAFLGRHSLIVYLVHQPVIFLLCYAAQGIVFSWNTLTAFCSAVF